MEQLLSKIPELDRRTVESMWWLGCHRCQELQELLRSFPNLKRLTLVEPMMARLGVLRVARKHPHLEITFVSAAATSRETYKSSEGLGRFILTSNDLAASSLRQPSENCTKHFPQVSVIGVHMDTPLTWLGLLGEAPDLLMMDIQGSEYDVLHQAMDVVERIRYIYSEVCYVELYNGQGMYEDLRRLLEIESRFTLAGVENEDVTYGNALWVNEGVSGCR